MLLITTKSDSADLESGISGNTPKLWLEGEEKSTENSLSKILYPTAKKSLWLVLLPPAPQEKEGRSSVLPVRTGSSSFS